MAAAGTCGCFVDCNAGHACMWQFDDLMGDLKGRSISPVEHVVQECCRSVFKSAQHQYVAVTVDCHLHANTCHHSYTAYTAFSSM
jgi:hypothetical protein